MKRLWQIAIVFLFAAATIAEARQAKADGRGIEYFRVVPGNCIVKSEELCRVRFQFYWQLYRAEEACIYLERAKEAVYCSPILKTGEVALDLAVSGNTSFTLVLKQAPEYSVSRGVKVLVMGRDLRLRRRHLWSLL